MNANLSSDLTVATLAAQTGYCRAHFLHMFRATTGKTPHQYLLDLRLDEAERKMRAGSTPLIDIAAACGFSIHSHLSEAFRYRFGMTPGQYCRKL
jgi:AraC family transcriptional regulator